MMTDDPKKYEQLEPEKDPNLQNNPHYWLYKVTREALDNKDHPLADMGHIWNRWACEGLSAEEREEIKTLDSSNPINSDSNRLSAYSNILSDVKKKEIETHINDEIRYFNIYNFVWDFSKVDVDIDFNGCTWKNRVFFSNFIFTQKASFVGNIFIKNASFNRTIFMKYFLIWHTECMEDVDFTGANFIQEVHFWGTIFTQNAKFIFAIFTRKAQFSDLKFNKTADFTGITFMQQVTFQDTSFIQDVNFLGVTFTQDVIFPNTKFLNNIHFFGTRFIQSVDFSSSKFMGNIINFNGAKFLKPTNPESLFSFAHSIFQTKVNFSESEFHHLPDLTGTDFRAGINLDKVKFPSDLCHCESCKAGRSNPENSDQQQNNPRGLKLDCHSPQRGLRNDEDIKGGLKTYKDAAITWHALQTEMEKAGYHEQAVTYFGYELEAKYLDENTDTSFKLVLWLYKHISSYGQSISRPFLWWIGLIGVFWFLHSFAFLFTYSIDMQFCLYAIKKLLISFQLSLKGAFPFISDQTTFFDRMFDNDDKNKIIPANNTLELLWFPILHGLHTLLSLILIFLFGLGVRHRLRLT